MAALQTQLVRYMWARNLMAASQMQLGEIRLVRNPIVFYQK